MVEMSGLTRVMKAELTIPSAMKPSPISSDVSPSSSSSQINRHSQNKVSICGLFPPAKSNIMSGRSNACTQTHSREGSLNDL